MAWNVLNHVNASMCVKLHLGYDNHISADFVSFCIQNRINLLPPHLSYLLQSLDVDIFLPLKHAISKPISHLLHSILEEFKG